MPPAYTERASSPDDHAGQENVRSEFWLRPTPWRHASLQELGCGVARAYLRVLPRDVITADLLETRAVPAMILSSRSERNAFMSAGVRGCRVAPDDGAELRRKLMQRLKPDTVVLRDSRFLICFSTAEASAPAKTFASSGGDLLFGRVDGLPNVRADSVRVGVDGSRARSPSPRRSCPRPLNAPLASPLARGSRPQLS